MHQISRFQVVHTFWHNHGVTSLQQTADMQTLHASFLFLLYFLFPLTIFNLLESSPGVTEANHCAWIRAKSDQVYFR